MTSKMQEVRKTALACYDEFSDDLKDKAFAVFEAMDSDGNGTVSIKEYEEYFGNSNRTSFNELDADGDGKLDFEECITLFYILMTSRGECTIPLPLFVPKDQPNPSQSKQVQSMEVVSMMQPNPSQSRQMMQPNPSQSRQVHRSSRAALWNAVQAFNTLWSLGSACNTIAGAVACAIM